MPLLLTCPTLPVLKRPSAVKVIVIRAPGFSPSPHTSNRQNESSEYRNARRVILAAICAASVSRSRVRAFSDVPSAPERRAEDEGPNPCLCTASPRPATLIHADGASQEEADTVLRGITLVIGKPREVMTRRLPSSLTVEVVDDQPTVEHGHVRARAPVRSISLVHDWCRNVRLPSAA